MNNIKVLAIIQARMSSSRLPKKILLKIKKKILSDKNESAFQAASTLKKRKRIFFTTLLR